MTEMIFVNLPVTDLPASIRFYEAVGFTNNSQFTTDQAASMMWSDHIAVMLMTHDFWKTLTTKTIPDAHDCAQVVLCLSQRSREAVNAIVDKAAAAGGNAEPVPEQYPGFMYGRHFEDPDGHVWQNVWMDPAFANREQPVESTPA